MSERISEAKTQPSSIRSPEDILKPLPQSMRENLHVSIKDGKLKVKPKKPMSADEWILVNNVLKHQGFGWIIIGPIKIGGWQEQ